MRNVSKRFTRQLTYANVVATGALFMALGGGAYAAFSGIPDAQGVYHGCVDPTTGALRIVKAATFCHKAKTIRRGHRRVHLAGELAIAWNQTGQQGGKGNPGQLGPTGPIGATGVAGTPAPTVLQSGQTETGLWGGGFKPAAGGDVWRPYAAFRIPLPADLDGSHVVYVVGSSATNCPGIGQAAPGYLCVYQQRFQGSVNEPASNSIENPDTPIGGVGAGAYGFTVFLVASAGGVQVDISGIYSVTAP